MERDPMTVEKTINGVILGRGHKPKRIKAHLLWDPTDPATVSILIEDGREFPPVWEVARDTFLGAGHKAMAGAWVGSGDFAVRMSRHGMTQLSFRPHDQPNTIAIVVLEGHGVPSFIADTLRIVPTGAMEETLMLCQVDKAIERIFDNA